MADAQRPSIGRVVHYVLPSDRGAGQHRPAFIVRVWGEGEIPDDQLGTVQLQVFTDCTNDGLTAATGSNGILWATSVQHDESGAPGTWHWPERA